MRKSRYYLQPEAVIVTTFLIFHMKSVINLILSDLCLQFF